MKVMDGNVLDLQNVVKRCALFLRELFLINIVYGNLPHIQTIKGNVFEQWIPESAPFFLSAKVTGIIFYLVQLAT